MRLKQWCAIPDNSADAEALLSTLRSERSIKKLEVDVAEWKVHQAIIDLRMKMKDVDVSKKDLTQSEVDIGRVRYMVQAAGIHLTRSSQITRLFIRCTWADELPANMTDEQSEEACSTRDSAVSDRVHSPDEEFGGSQSASSSNGEYDDNVHSDGANTTVGAMSDNQSRLSQHSCSHCEHERWYIIDQKKRARGLSVEI